MAFAAQDSAYQEYAAQLFLQAGRDALTHRAFDSAMVLLNHGRPWARTAQLPAYSNITGRVQILKIQSLLTEVDSTRSCATAHAADSWSLSPSGTCRRAWRSTARAPP